MVKKALLGCSVFLVLAAVAMAVLINLNWDRSGIDASDAASGSLSQDIAKEFGGQPEVEFLCVLPVVGPAPCVLDSDKGSREASLTFTNYELPEGIAPEELARRIAVRSFQVSDFVRHSSRTDVIFEIAESGGSATTSRTSKYSFGPEDLALAAGVSDVPSHEAPGDGDTSGE